MFHENYHNCITIQVPWCPQLFMIFCVRIEGKYYVYLLFGVSLSLFLSSSLMHMTSEGFGERDRVKHPQTLRAGTTIDVSGNFKR